MRFVINYTFRPHMDKDDVAELMEAFAAAGNAPGTTQHFLWVDGSGGTTFGETDDLMSVYRNLLGYTEWIEFDLKPVLAVEEALPEVADYLS